MQDHDFAFPQLEAIHSDYLICFDCDGCILDSMTIKQMECFCGNFITCMGLQDFENDIFEIWNLVTLRSIKRGSNRFLTLIDIHNLLSIRFTKSSINMSKFEIKDLKEWIESGDNINHFSLQNRLNKVYSPQLSRLLHWSETANNHITSIVDRMNPFPSVSKALDHVWNRSDSIVISQSPTAILKHELQEKGLSKYFSNLFGQEYGPKAQVLGKVLMTKYQKNKVLMVGDSPGDLRAAQANQVLFFPIIPGAEEECWRKFKGEAADRFLSGSFEGSYQQGLLDDFQRSFLSLP